MNAQLLNMILIQEQIDITLERINMFSNSDNPDNLRYNIIRFYWDHPNGCISRRTLQRNVSHEAARAHCNNPETSSSTCVKPYNKARTKKLGAWFDVYERA